MPAPVLSLLLQLVLHMEDSPRAPPVSAPESITGAPRITVTEEAFAREREVKIRPGQGLLLIFDTPVRLDTHLIRERGFFKLVSLSEDGLVLTLIPSTDLPMGRRLALGVRFMDEELPARLNLLLVAHPEAAFQVEVYRHPRSGVSYQQEAEETRAQLAQCRMALTQERAERRAPSGLMGLLFMRQMGSEGIRGHRMVRETAFRQADALEMVNAVSYLVPSGTQTDLKVRLAVELTVWNTGMEPWRPTRVELVTEGGRWRMDVWAPEPLAPGVPVRILAEVEVPEAEMPTGPGLLRLWNDEGTRLAVLSGVTFP